MKWDTGTKTIARMKIRSGLLLKSSWWTLWSPLAAPLYCSLWTSCKTFKFPAFAGFFCYPERTTCHPRPCHPERSEGSGYFFWKSIIPTWNFLVWMLLLKIFLARPWFLVYIYKCAGGSPLVQKGRREKLGCLGCLGCVGTLLVSSVAAEAAIREWKVWEFSQQCKNPPEISPTDFFCPNLSSSKRSVGDPLFFFSAWL